MGNVLSMRTLKGVEARMRHGRYMKCGAVEREAAFQTPRPQIQGLLDTAKRVQRRVCAVGAFQDETDASQVEAMRIGA